MFRVKFKLLHENAKLPVFKTDGSVGADIYAIKKDRVPKGQTRVIKTGLACEIPDGYHFSLQGRSGLSVNQNYHVKLGLIDEDFIGEMGVIIQNNDQWDDLIIEEGDRIGQLVLRKTNRFQPVEVDELTATERGESGFGSTGS